MSKSATPSLGTDPVPSTDLDTGPALTRIRRPVASAYVRPPEPPVRLTGRGQASPPSGQSGQRQLTDHPEHRREWLTETQVEAIIKHAAIPRDKAMILVAYRHGLRVSELITLRWRDIDLEAARLKVHRLKGSEPSVHPISGRELRTLRSLRRGMGPNARFVFVTANGTPMTRNGFYKLLAKAAERAGVSDVHPHLLRHATGFKLVNDGLDTLSLAAYLGHANVNNTKRYTKMNATRFDNLWRD